MSQKWLRLALAASILGIYWAISRLWRIRYENVPRRLNGRKPIVYAHWHGDELLLVAAHAGSGMAVLSSRSKDGEVMGRVLRGLGYHVARGSSSRGGVGGLKALIDAVNKEGRDASLAVDGPRGPIYKVKPGVLKLAQATGCDLVLGVAAASRAFVFEKAWNRCYLPYPFAECVVRYSDRIPVPEKMSHEELESLRLRVEKNLIALKGEAERYFGRSFQAELLPVGV